MIPKPLKHLV